MITMNLALKNAFTTRSKQLGTAILLGSFATLSQVANAADDSSTTIPLDLSGMNTTKHEIALMQVLSEICPPMLANSQKQKFYKSYNVQLQELLPTIDDPKAAIQYLSTQQDYKNVLRSIRSWTLGFSKKDNKALCEDLANTTF